MFAFDAGMMHICCVMSWFAGYQKKDTKSRRFVHLIILSIESFHCFFFEGNAWSIFIRNLSFPLQLK